MREIAYKMTFTWLGKEFLKRETESPLIAAPNNPRISVKEILVDSQQTAATTTKMVTRGKHSIIDNEMKNYPDPEK